MGGGSVRRMGEWARVGGKGGMGCWGGACGGGVAEVETRAGRPCYCGLGEEQSLRGQTTTGT